MIALLALICMLILVVYLITATKAASERNSHSASARPGILYYRTRDGRADYVFQIEWVDGGHRAYIVSMPSYGNRDTSLHTTHRLISGGRHYVCWSQPLATIDEAKTVIALWSDFTQEYIRSGRTIDQQVAASR
jgi:hypothetical protein